MIPMVLVLQFKRGRREEHDQQTWRRWAFRFYGCRRNGPASWYRPSHTGQLGARGTHQNAGRGGARGLFRTADVEALYQELHPASEVAEAIAADEQESAGEAGAQRAPRKKQDPQMRVYLRLQADAKWYD